MPAAVVGLPVEPVVDHLVVEPDPPPDREQLGEVEVQQRVCDIDRRKHGEDDQREPERRSVEVLQGRVHLVRLVGEQNAQSHRDDGHQQHQQRGDQRAPAPAVPPRGPEVGEGQPAELPPPHGGARQEPADERRPDDRGDVDAEDPQDAVDQLRRPVDRFAQRDPSVIFFIEKPGGAYPGRVSCL